MVPIFFSCLLLSLQQPPAEGTSSNGRHHSNESVLIEAERAGTPMYVDQLHLIWGDGCRTATVEFAVEGNLVRYPVSLSSAFTSETQARALKTAGSEDCTIALLDIGTPLIYESRLPKKWASCALSGNAVSGVFEDGDGWIELRRSDQADFEDKLALLGLAKHYAYRHHVHDTSGLTHAMQPQPEVVIDGGDYMKESASDRLHDGKMARGGLTKWFPNCYRGDGALHELKLALIGDINAYKDKGEGLKSFIREHVAQASLVYEKQINIRLTISSLDIYKDAGGAPAAAKGSCGSGFSFLGRKLGQMKNTKKAATILITGCKGKGANGVASIGGFCRQNGVAVVSLRPKDRVWVLIAHELGHVIGAQHSFEDGRKKTGGIMDYPPRQKVNGIYQFNTKYRKKEMCRSFMKNVGKCSGNFVKASGPSPSPSSPSPSSPSPSPGPRPGKGGKGGKGDSPSPSPSSPSPSPSPSSPSPSSPSPSPGPRPGKGGKGGKGGSPSPLPPSPSPEEQEPETRRRRRRRRGSRRRRTR